MVALIAAAHPSDQVANATYLWLWVLVGALTLIGSGIGAVRWLRNQGRADGERAAEAAEVKRILSEQGAMLKRLMAAVKPNGLDTDFLGDMAKRTEIKMDQLIVDVKEQGSKLDSHLGDSGRAEREIWRELKKKVDR
jgi:hypothetical protein